MTINEYCEKIISQNQSQVELYTNGKKGVLGYLLGMVMKECHGSENPKFVRQTMRELLDGKIK